VRGLAIAAMVAVALASSIVACLAKAPRPKPLPHNQETNHGL
jgi:hypothetical protein